MALTESAVAGVRRLSADAAPLEGCGYLVAERGVVVAVHPTPNVHAEPRTRYAVDPAGYLDLDDALDGTGREVVGVVHSHPFTHAVPSATDREHAVPGWWYLIHGFPPERPEGELRAWRLADADPDGPFREHPLERRTW